MKEESPYSVTYLLSGGREETLWYPSKADCDNATDIAEGIYDKGHDDGYSEGFAAGAESNDGGALFTGILLGVGLALCGFVLWKQYKKYKEESEEDV